MANVKGSPVYRLKVVPHRPIKSALVFFLSLTLICAALIATYRYAVHQTASDRLTQQDANELRAALATSENELAELRRNLMRMEVNADVDRQAGEELRKQVLGLRQEKAALAREIDVFRIMTSDRNRNPKGISFGVFSVTELPDNKHLLKLAVQKLAEGEEDFTGQLRFFVVGQREGQEMRISLHEIAVSKVGVEPLAENIPLNFKFFQNIETEIVIPDGFVPSRVELAVKSESRRAPVSVEGQLEWPEIR